MNFNTQSLSHSRTPVGPSHTIALKVGAALIFVLSALIFLGGRLAGESKTISKAQLNEKMRKAIEAAQLSSPGSSGFHLVANFRYELGSYRSEGSYELQWISPDRYRETFSSAKNTQVEVALDDKLFTSRRAGGLPPELWSVRKLIDAPFQIVPAAPRAEPRSIRAIAGEPENACVEYSYVQFYRKACFQVGTEQISLAQFSSLSIPAMVVTRTLEDFAQIGTKRFPRHLAAHEVDQNTDIRITTLTAETQFTAETLLPPEGASARAWCAQPTVSRAPARRTQLASHDELESLPIFLTDPKDHLLLFYAVVGADGDIEKSTALRALGPHLQKQLDRWLNAGGFEARSCAGKGIEYETILVAPYLFRIKQ